MATDKIQYGFTSDKGTFYRITIIDTDPSASPTLFTNPLADSNGFELTYETEDDNRFTGLIPSMCKIGFFVKEVSSGVFNNVDSIKISEYGRWQLLIENSTTDSNYQTFWVGNLLNEINSEKDASAPTFIQLTAICGLAALKDIPFNNTTPYGDLDSRFSPFRYIFNSIINDIGTSNNWSSSDILIKTVVDWTNSVIPRNAQTDPLVFSRFKATAYAPIDDTGKRRAKTSFKLLDDICKVFGARMFLSNGKWQIIQVNTYYQMSSSAQFFREYNKGNSTPHTTPDNSGTYQNDLKTEGIGEIVRFNGDFDQLGILKQVDITYDTLRSYDLSPEGKNITTSAGTNTAPDNALVAWNGYATDSDGFVTNSNIYDVNNSTTNFASYNLGEVTAGFDQSIRVNRVFNRAFLGTESEYLSITNPSPNYAKIIFYHRLKIDDGAGNQRFTRTNYFGNTLTNWTTGDYFGNSPTLSSISEFFGNFFLAQPGPFPIENFVLNFQTAEIPLTGTLFFECFAQMYKNYEYTESPQEDGTEITNAADTVKFYIFSAPENTDEEMIQVFVNGQQTTKSVFAVNQNIENGLTFSIDEVFFGSGPNSAADGALQSSANGTTFDDGTNQTWVAYGSGSGQNILKLLIEEVIKGQVTGAKIFNGSLKFLADNVNTNGYKFNNAIRIDSDIYLPYQCSFNANKDTWSGQWYQINLGSPTLISTTDLSPFEVSDRFSINYTAWN